MKDFRPILIIITALLGLIIFNLHSSSFGLVFNSLTGDFDWSRTEVTGVLSSSRFFWIPLVLAAGVVLDWRGGRLVMIVGSLAAALGGYGLSTIDSFSQFRTWYYVFSAGNFIFLVMDKSLVFLNINS